MSIQILYDAGGFRETHGGVSRYFTEMMKRLPDEFEWKLGMVSTSNAYLLEPPFNLPPHKQTVQDFIRDTLHGHSFRGVSYVYKALACIMPNRFPSGELANQRAMRTVLDDRDFDILHVTHPHPVKNTWRSVVGQKPIVATIHDLIPEILQGNLRVAACRRQLLNDATRVIAVSENTKRDIMRIYGTNESKISVIYHGNIQESSVITERLKDIPWPYILYVGKRDGYKNFTFFIEAIAPLLRQSELGLFCTGTGFNEQERAMLDRLEIGDKVMQRFVADSVMPSLFANAVVFVYPSLYEGFGIPILDAFSVGCPVILSDCSCFPEVAGDAALYFSPTDGIALRNNIVNVMNDGTLRNVLVEKGLRRSRMFSWWKCAKETATFYRDILNDAE